MGLLQKHRTLQDSGSSNPLGSKTEDNEEYADSFYFHDDILIEILSRVPADRLQVFKRVCSHWRVLISSYEFFKLHRTRAKDEAFNKKVMFVEYTSVSQSSSSRQAILLQPDGNLPKILVNWKQCDDTNTYNVIGSCDGLLMFRMQPSLKSLILNPSTQETRIIESPNESGITCGIFFDRFEDDYKLLHVYSGRRNGLYGDYIFSFKRHKWSRLNSVKTYHMFLPRLDDPPVVVCDALHWIAQSDFLCSKMVLVFKIETKEVFFLPYPNAIYTELYTETDCCLAWGDEYPMEGIDNNESMRLIEKDGKLCLCHTIVPSRTIEIWLLRNYENWGSWARMYKIDLFSVWKYRLPKNDWYCQGCMKSVKIVSFGDDHILIAWPYRRLCLYNLETKMMRLIEDPKFRNSSMEERGSYSCIPLTKTLLSPKNVYTTPSTTGD